MSKIGQKFKKGGVKQKTRIRKVPWVHHSRRGIFCHFSFVELAMGADTDKVDMVIGNMLKNRAMVAGNIHTEAS